MPKEKISCFQEKNTMFPDNTRKIMPQRDHVPAFFEKVIFEEKFKENYY